MTISVLVVDDSVVIRRLVTSVLDADPDITVVGTAANGRLALAKLDQLTPDLVTLDIEMPELDGLETLKVLRRTHPRLPVVMFSTLTERAAKATLEALALGANDYVAKPANVGSMVAGMESVRSQLIPKIKALCPARLPAAARPVLAPRSPAPAGPGPAPAGVRAPGRAAPAAAGPAQPPRVLVIGCSTGGPQALTALLSALPASLPLPVLVVQHMPPVFTAMFAQRLYTQCALRVREAADGDALEPGLVLVAPGDFHLTIARTGSGAQVRLDQSPPQNWCRPAVDPLFSSAAEVYGGAVLSVVLTGMGQDGLRGAQRLREVGAPVLVQDEASSVVWGMPGAIATAGLATRVLPLHQLAGEVLAALAPQRRAALLGAGGPR